MRLACARINQETNALSPVATTFADFEAVHLLRGDAIAPLLGWWATEVKSMFRNAELSGFAQRVERRSSRQRPLEVVPLLSAWAVPSGPLTRACFDALLADLTEQLRRAGDVDAVYLSLHGAMGVHDLPLDVTSSPDAEIVRHVRNLVGPAVPIAVSLDLHANLCPALIEQATVVQAYQTNPHRDHAAIGKRCADWLIDIVDGRIKPMMAWRSLPMILGGGTTVDLLAPMRSIFTRMTEMERGRVLGTSVLMSHPWNDHRELGWGTLVVTNDDQAAADRCADELAERCWAVRDHLPPTFTDPSSAIAKARAATWQRKLGVVVMSDASDVVSAGAPGESTALIQALIDAPDLASMAALRDPQAVAALHLDAKVGDQRALVLGRKLDKQRGSQLSVDAIIESIGSNHGHGRYVIVRVANTRIVLVEGPALVAKPAFYRDLGVDLWKLDVVVVKNFFPFLLFFLPYARKTIFVRTSGITDLDAGLSLSFAGPVHPKDVVADWRDTDARRRYAAAAE
jgi:microcystin degradation protein MlrC